MNLTDHACFRYAERIVNLERKEAKRYAIRNRDKIVRYVTKMIDHATFIWCGRLGSNQERNFYLRDSIILVTDKHDETVITLYRADYGFSEETNRQFVKELLEEIEKDQDDIKKEELKIKLINSIEYRFELETVS